MGSERRERRKANREAKLAAEAAAAKRKRMIALARNAVILVIVIIIALALLSCSSENDEGAETAGRDGAPSGPVEGTEDVEWGTTPCPPADGLEEPQIDFDDSFEQCIDPSATYTAEIETTHGTFTIELDAEDMPLTTNNFVALARSGYYDGTALFRTEADTGIIQGGSPHTQSAADPGPGYTIADEGPLATSADYGPGTLAMARTSAPDSASAQFFLLSGEGGRYLGDQTSLGASAGTYRVFGNTIEGLDVLETISNLDDGTRVPSEPVSITSVTITES